MTTNLPPPARGRLTRELSLLQNDPPPGCAAYAPDESDISSLRAQISGPPSTPFEEGVFLLSVRITPRYPFEPPRVRFLTAVYHPNVDSAGRICLDTLKSPPAGSWSPAVSLPSLLLSIRSLLAEPNPDDGLVPEISEEFKRFPERFREEARRRTAKYATSEKTAELERSLDRGNSAKGEKKKANEALDGTENRSSDDTQRGAGKIKEHAPSGRREGHEEKDSSSKKRKLERPST